MTLTTLLDPARHDTRRFSSMDAAAVALRRAPGPDTAAAAGARTRNQALTKPAGALGRLEELAIWYAAWRGAARPRSANAHALIFAGSHGVAARGVSAYPSGVTAQMVENFRQGGAAINQLSDLTGARLTIVPMALDTPTHDFTDAPALEEASFLAALSTGAGAVDEKADCLILGEMGIGNTTAAAAVAAALFGGEATDWTGAGTGVAGDALDRKLETVRLGVARHAAEIAAAGPHAPLEALRRLGGRELAAVCGAVLRARELKIPVILDGFITTIAAAPLALMVPGALDHCMAGHVSAEAGHRRLLAVLGKQPLLDLGLRLGEGSGAAVAFGLLQAALACHCGMASFDQAGVDGPANRETENADIEQDQSDGSTPLRSQGASQ